MVVDFVFGWYFVLLVSVVGLGVLLILLILFGFVSGVFCVVFCDLWFGVLWWCVLGLDLVVDLFNGCGIWVGWFGLGFCVFVFSCLFGVCLLYLVCCLGLGE